MVSPISSIKANQYPTKVRSVSKQKPAPQLDFDDLIEDDGILTYDVTKSDDEIKVSKPDAVSPQIISSSFIDSRMEEISSNVSNDGRIFGHIMTQEGAIKRTSDLISYCRGMIQVDPLCVA